MLIDHIRLIDSFRLINIRLTATYIGHMAKVFRTSPIFTIKMSSGDSNKCLRDLTSGKKVAVAEVTVIRLLQDNISVVADGKNSAALLLAPSDKSNMKMIEVGKGIKIIKPNVKQKEPLVMEINKHFKIVPGKAIAVKVADNTMKLLEDLALSFKKEETNVNFSEVDSMPVGSDGIIKEPVTVLVTSISKICKNNYGKYQIAQLKDLKGEKNTLFLYGGSIGKMEKFNVYTISKYKRGVHEHSESSHFKLQTTRYTQVAMAAEENAERFKEVPIADHRKNGVLIAICNFSVYR
jgi:hypothetical protein